jgi:peptidoglycan/LPS O-acetylase OafA/YrhL
MNIARAGRAVKREGSYSSPDAEFRPDIEGLRAFAVIVVILDHVVSWPSGGFIGVDVFFVISGFLITGILMRQYERTGRISFATFYTKRIKRILPVAVVVLLCTVLVSALLYFTPRSSEIASQGLSSLIFVENWHLIRLGTNYLGGDSGTSPLQHYWSLSVEEQFYVFWPWGILLVAAVSSRLRRRPALTTALAAVLGLLIVASFAWSVYETATRPSWSYFSFESRAFELATGALVYVVGRRVQLPSRWRPAVAVVGMLLLLASVFALSTATPFPGPGAALPVAGTGMIIVAGIGSTPTERARARFLVPLTNPVSRHLGKISYSLYLWHFPIIIFATSLWPAGGALVPLGALLLTFAISELSYRFIEKPARSARWRPRALTRLHWFRPVRRPLRLAALITAAFVLLALVHVASIGGQGESASAIPSAARLADEITAVPGKKESGTELQHELGSALHDTSWSSLVPDLDHTDDSDTALQTLQPYGCIHDVFDGPTDASRFREETANCSFGPPDASHTAVVLGDSIAISWMPAVIGALVPQGWRVTAAGYESCAANDSAAQERRLRPGFPDACSTARAAAEQQVVAMRPDLILVSSALGSFQRLLSGDVGASAQLEWRSGELSTLRRLAESGARIIVVGSPPESVPVEDCATRLTGPSSCEYSPGDDWKGKTAAEVSGVAIARAQGIDVDFIDTLDWFCTPAEECPALVGSTLVKIDNGHLSTDYSAQLSPLLAEALRQS